MAGDLGEQLAILRLHADHAELEVLSEVVRLLEAGELATPASTINTTSARMR